MFSCNNDENNNAQKDTPELQNKLLQNIDSPIGTIDNGVVIPSFNIADFKAELLQLDFFAEIESIEFDQNFLTVIGKDKNDFSLVAWQFRLRTVGNQIFFPPTEFPMDVMTVHKCAGASCSSCELLEIKIVMQYWDVTVKQEEHVIIL